MVQARHNLFAGVLAGAPQFFEDYYVYPDGQRRLVSGNYIPHKNEDGSIIGFYALAMDVTERHALEERLRQAQKMEAVGQLTGGVAHDFNNLLAIILGNAEMLTSNSSRSQTAPQAIVRAAERGAELTRNLLAFSRKQPLAPRIIDPAALVADMSELMRRSLGATIEITTSSEPELWTAMADPGQLENALLNLALNARDAMPGGGKLTLDCRNIQLQDVDIAEDIDAMAGDYVMLAVSDTGTGMDAETRQHVFEPFYTTKGVGEGSGLGLSMVYGFAKQSGGHVDICSEPGLGTTVKLYLPRATHPSAEIEPVRREASPSGHGEAVLVIEDDAEVRELTVAMLEAMDYRVTAAADAAAARKVIEGGAAFDLLLSDVVLPGGTSGPDFARELCRGEPGLKVIFMSGYPDDAAIGGGLLDPGSVLLNKPFYLRQLATAMREALG
ncbi:MAG: response regulator [Alphaproteobacteria bacterium]|nr:response regulator [Alphaproteobacteria bacterium]